MNAYNSQSLISPCDQTALAYTLVPLHPKCSVHNGNPLWLSSSMCLLQHIWPGPFLSVPSHLLSLPSTICKKAQWHRQSHVYVFVHAVLQAWNALFLVHTNPTHSSRPSISSPLQLCIFYLKHTCINLVPFIASLFVFSFVFWMQI